MQCDDCTNDDNPPSNEDDVDEDEDVFEAQQWHASSNDISQFYGEEQYRIKFKFEAQARFMFGVAMVEREDGLVEGIRLPMHTYSGQKILGMGKWEEGVELAKMNARKSTRRTWLTKRDCPLGKEIFMNDPIAILPEIGEQRGIYLNECGIFYVCDAEKSS